MLDLPVLTSSEYTINTMDVKINMESLPKGKAMYG
jgi:hypothetical protein